MPTPEYLRVCTLNCWGLKYVAKDREERISAIATALAASDYDIIALQEIWVSADYQHVRNSLSKRLPYAKYFYSGALGAGLAIFSRWPFIGATIYPYSLNGSPIDVAGGDWFVGKAAASVVIQHPSLGPLQIFNTHLFAKGGESGPVHHMAHRLVNAWEFAKLARQASDMGRHVIAMGDFNSVPTGLPMTIVRDHAGLTDAWLETHPENDGATVSRTPSGAPTPAAALELHGITADSPLNSYSAGKPLEGYAREHGGKRLDYVFTRSSRLRAVQTRVALTERVPRRAFSYSDHFALEATFALVPEDAPLAPVTPVLSHESLTSTLQALTTCYRLSRARSRVYLSAFAGCIATLLVVAIGSAWIPRSWANPVIVLFTTAVAWLGTTMLYVGFVYGRWEVNALMNIIEELEIYQGLVRER